jgi:hypothetical protein
MTGFPLVPPFGVGMISGNEAHSSHEGLLSSGTSLSSYLQNHKPNSQTQGERSCAK